MRDLYRNMTSLWYVAPTNYTDDVDTDGFYTGESSATFSTPIEIRMSLYPSGGGVAEKMFGKESSFDMVASSTLLDLNENGFLFLEEPTGDYDSTYDYKISKVNRSINSYHYGLDKRV